MRAKTVSVILALSLVTAITSAAGAACRVTGWTGGGNSYPVFECG